MDQIPLRGWLGPSLPFFRCQFPHSVLEADDLALDEASH